MVLGPPETRKAIFLNTHNLDFALNVADEIVIMNSGKIIRKIDRVRYGSKIITRCISQLRV